MAAKVRNTVMAALALAMVGLIFAPMAQAQTGTTLDMTVTAPSGNLVPEVQIGTLKADIEYSGQSAPQALAPLAATSLPITFNPQCPSTVLVVGPTTKIMPLNPTEGAGTLQGSTSASFQVSITRDAPGLKSIQCTLTAAAPALTSAGVEAPDDAQQRFIVTADYYGLLQAKVATKIQQAGPQKEVPFSIELTNFGNARTQVSFEITNAPAGERWTAVVPDNIILDSPNGGGEGKTSDNAVFTVSTPYKNGWNNEQGAYQITIRPTSADVPDKQGNPLAANVLVRVRGVYVPSLEPVIMLGALVGSAFVLRNREEE